VRVRVTRTVSTDASWLKEGAQQSVYSQRQHARNVSPAQHKVQGTGWHSFQHLRHGPARCYLFFSAPNYSKVPVGEDFKYFDYRVLQHHINTHRMASHEHYRKVRPVLFNAITDDHCSSIGLLLLDLLPSASTFLTNCAEMTERTL